MSQYIDPLEGRALFGINPENYDGIRPPYPEQVYDFIIATGALRPGIVTLEIGAGNGLATRRLLECGVDPLTVVEPDSRFFPLLSSIASSYSADVCLIEAPFEDAELPRCHYDLVVAATSFHWIQPDIGLAKVADVLKPGGYIALWWHVFGDSDRYDPYHEATLHILGSLPNSPSSGPGTVEYAANVSERCRDFLDTGCFEAPEYMIHRWTLELNTAQVGALYATFSPISRLPEPQRASILDQLMRVAEERFGGKVVRNMVSPVYVARRKADTY